MAGTSGNRCARRRPWTMSVRALKSMALHRAFARFVEKEWKRCTCAAKFRAYADEQSWWLDDYALFARCTRILASVPGPTGRNRFATGCPTRSPTREPSWMTTSATAAIVQWIAGEQWAAARRDAQRLFGDLPFAVSGDSADVWARQDEFNPALSVGVLPDAFSASGQDWGLPAYRWDGHWPNAISTGCASEPGAMRISSTAIEWTTSLASIDVCPSARRRRGRVHACRPGRADSARRADPACSPNLVPRSLPRISV